MKNTVGAGIYTLLTGRSCFYRYTYSDTLNAETNCLCNTAQKAGMAWGIPLGTVDWLRIPRNWSPSEPK